MNGADILYVSDLQAAFDQAYTDNIQVVVYPVGSGSSFQISLGVKSFAPTNFYSWISNGWQTVDVAGDITGYPVFFEENAVSNQRIRSLSGLNDQFLLTWTNNWDAAGWITNVYGEVPYWENAADWMALRDPSRLHYSMTLLSPDDYATWLEMNTPTAVVPVVTSTRVPVSFTNNLYLMIDYAGDRSLWLYNPQSYTNADIFSAEDLINPDWLLNNTLYNPETYAQIFFNDALDHEYIRAADADIDSDGDGLSNAREELLYGTRSDLADTDFDGLLDGEEILTYGLNALNPDSDGDGLYDGTEVLSGTGLNPWLQDSDGDGILDSEEDSDGDGYSNLVEQENGSNINFQNTTVPGVHAFGDGSAQWYVPYAP